MEKLQPHRTQVLWGLGQGSYPLALYVWSVTKTRVRAFYQAQKDDEIKRLQQENAKLKEALPEGNVLEETFNRR